MRPELHRPLPIGGIGPAGADVTVEASPAECSELAERLGIPAVRALTCRFHLERDGDRVIAHGQLRAEVVQTCVVSLEDFEAAVHERFTLRFVPEGEESDDLDPELPDDVGYAGDVLDLGEAAAEQLALALDPYPRAPGAELPDMSDDTASHPFAQLSGLKRPN